MSLSLQPIPDLLEARRATTALGRLEALRSAGQTFRERFAAGPTVHAVQACDLSALPYPTKYAFWGAARSVFPYVTILNRMHVVQFESGGELRTLLVNPSDIDGNQRTPYIAAIAKAFPEFAIRMFQVRRAEHHLAALDIAPESVDYLTFDHLHTQDIQAILGTPDNPGGLYPNAKLLVQRAEWESVVHLHPVQKYWYVPDVHVGIDESRLVLLDGDVDLGGGVALLSTPGHTIGNHTITLNTEGGVYCISENGVAADCYAPEKSHIAGLARFARSRGVEVILNANTMQSSEEQYTSMVLEKTVAGRSARDHNFFNVAPSSELQPSFFAPGLSPTFAHGRIRYGGISPGYVETTETAEQAVG